MKLGGNEDEDVSSASGPKENKEVSDDEVHSDGKEPTNTETDHKDVEC